MKSLLIGVDIGTQGTKAMLFDAAGRCLASAFEDSRLHRPGPGVVEEDPERQVGSVCRTIRQCLAKSRAGAGDVAAIGIDGQMAGVIGVGRDGRNVTPYDSWLDTRCGPYIRKMDPVADEVVARAGNAPSFNHGPKKLWWKHERPEIYARIAAFVQPGGYAAMRLCGLTAAEAFVDETYLHFSGFADNRKRAWNVALCRELGLDPAKLPRIVAPHETIGRLSAGMARRCGLAPGVPVVAGCGDTAASFLACGATAEGICVDVAGTASVFAATTASFTPDVKERVLGVGRSATPGLWHPYAYINGGGMNLEWFRSRVAGGGRPAAARLDFKKLDRLAGAPRSEGAPLFVPHLGGRVSPPRPDLRGAWVGVTWDHGIGDLYRAVLEGVALEYAIYKRVLVSLYPGLGLRELRVTGGGERSAVWNRIKADTLGLPVRRIARSHGAPMGAALVAGYGAGLFRSLPAAAAEWIEVGAAVRPRRGRGAAAERRQAAYERALAALESIGA
jgi:xylulokinase